MRGSLVYTHSCKLLLYSVLVYLIMWMNLISLS